MTIRNVTDRDTFLKMISVCLTDLLLVFSLQVQSGLDVAPRLLKGLSLRDLCRVVGADPDDVGAQEDQHVRAQLREEKNTIQ